MGRGGGADSRDLFKLSKLELRIMRQWPKSKRLGCRGQMQIIITIIIN